MNSDSVDLTQRVGSEPFLLRPALDVSPTTMVELSGALEIRRILEEIKAAADAYPLDDMPTPFQSAWRSCCEEIFYRATGYRWHMDEDKLKFPEPPKPPGPAAEAVRPNEQKRMSIEQDAARYRWLRDHNCNSLSLSRDDDHACNYVTAKQWIEEYVPDNFADEDPAELQRMKDTNTIWALQVYPNTPVGFNLWHGATLDAVIDASIAAESARSDDQEGTT